MCSYVGAVRAGTDPPQQPSVPQAIRDELGLTEGTDVRHERENQEAIHPDLVEAITTMSRHAIMHPTQLSPSESLSEDFVRSSIGFLICNNIKEVTVDQEMVKNDSEYL